MTRSMKVRRPTTAEIRQLSQRLAGLPDQHQQRRAEALRLYGIGLNPLVIAQAQGVHVHTIYADLHAFEQAGVSAVTQLRPAGAPARLTPTQMAERVRLADQSPGEVGLPYSRWSLRKLSTYLVKKHIVKSIGPERLRQVLKKRLAHVAPEVQGVIMALSKAGVISLAR